MKYIVSFGDSFASKSVEVEAADYKAAIKKAVPDSDAMCHGVWEVRGSGDDEERVEVYSGDQPDV